MSLLSDNSSYVCTNSECTSCYEESKNELEEAAENTLEENYAYKDDGGDRVYFDTQVEKCIIDMTKWQAERMYSEEEVFEILRNFNQNALEYIKDDDRSIMTSSTLKKWFEQFKKK
jgi:hypothetical protein